MPTPTPNSPRSWILAALQAALLVPFLLSLNNYRHFRTFRLDAFDWSFTLFVVLLCLLIALGLFFADRPAFRTTVKPTRSPANILAAFWLPACAFGPFFAWITTSGAIPITHTTWHTLYAIRALLCVALPLLCVLPLLRYISGKAALIQIPLLLLITTLPLLAGLNYTRDLIAGPAPNPVTHQPNAYLSHTGVALSTNTSTHNLRPLPDQ
jgi:hypothetical protein